MSATIDIENIEQMRRERAIEDPELRDEIRGLVAGDFVRLTFRLEEGSFPGETLLVRITSIRGNAFRGRLAQRPSGRLVQLRQGRTIVFARAHIHSVSKGPGSGEK